jgi:hypothetical protein
LDIALRWIHILSAITLVGGVFFMKFALLPGLATLSADQQKSTATAVRKFWSKCVMATSGLLLISGLVNVARIMSTYGSNFDGPYHALLGVKILLALGVFWISAVLSGRSSTAEKFRQKESTWLSLNVVLAIAVVCVAGYMKTIDRTPKAEIEPDEAAYIEIEVDTQSGYVTV